MSAPRECRCPDPDDAIHCQLLQDFPGGFYGDAENADYYANDDHCFCHCHEEAEREDFS